MQPSYENGQISRFNAALPACEPRTRGPGPTTPLRTRECIWNLSSAVPSSSSSRDILSPFLPPGTGYLSSSVFRSAVVFFPSLRSSFFVIGVSRVVSSNGEKVRKHVRSVRDGSQILQFIRRGRSKRRPRTRKLPRDSMDQDDDDDDDEGSIDARKGGKKGAQLSVYVFSSESQ